MNGHASYVTGWSQDMSFRAVQQEYKI